MEHVKEHTNECGTKFDRKAYRKQKAYSARPLIQSIESALENDCEMGQLHMVSHDTGGLSWCYER
jgi:hypothetical protein